MVTMNIRTAARAVLQTQQQKKSRVLATQKKLLITLYMYSVLQARNISLISLISQPLITISKLQTATSPCLLCLISPCIMTVTEQFLMHRHFLMFLTSIPMLSSSGDIITQTVTLIMITFINQAIQ